jgi:hypothetical protein
MTHARPIHAGWFLWGLQVVVIVVAATLTVGSGDDPTGIPLTLAWLVLSTVGVVIINRRPGNSIGWILCVSGFISAVGSLADEYLTFAYTVRPLPAATWFGWLGNSTFALWLFTPISFVFLLFPNGHLPSPRWRPLAWLAGAVIAGWTLFRAFGDATLSDDPPIRNPMQISAVTQLTDVLVPITAVLVILIVLGPALSLVARFRHSQGAERQQLKWVAYWAVLEAAAVLLAGATAEIYGAEQSGVLGAIAWITTVIGLSLGLPAVIGIAILRYRLYDIDRLISRTLVYGGLTAILALVYVGDVLLFQLLLRPVAPQGNVAVAASTLLVAALFQPIRRRMQAVVDRRFYRRRYDAARTVAAFSSTARNEVDLGQLTGELVRVVETTLRPASISLWVRPMGDGGSAEELDRT